MSWLEILNTGWHSIRAHAMRSLLTTLGILIGIAAVILTVGLGLGTQKDVSEQISSLGSNLLIVTAGSSTDSSGVRGGFGTSTSLTTSDVDALDSEVATPDIAAVAAERTTSLSVEAGDTNWTTTVTGVTADWMEVRSRTLSSGEFLDMDATNEIVLGADAATELFGSTDVVGRSVTISGFNYTVVGVLESAGSSSSTNLDDIAVLPLNVVGRDLIGSDVSTVSTIYLKATDTDTISAAYQEAEALLLNLHGITNSDSADFSISSQDALVETATSIYQTLTVLLVGIAALSLLVGGIGVMNIMLVSVTERTREIGLRKALGAPPRTIRTQFLMEAAMLGIAGGILGIALGVVGALVLPSLLDTSIVISGAAIAGALAVALGIGIIFGTYPAARAARLAPIDALRSE